MNNLIDFQRVMALIVSDFTAIAVKLTKFIPEDEGAKSKKRSVKKK